MLSRKGSSAGMKGSSAGMKGSSAGMKGSSPGMVGSGPVMGAGADRSRVGERLRAALAGLQELHLLKDRQGDMVSWALRLDREEPVSAGLPDPTGAEEQRLEATLTTLKQQLARLRKQDVGLKSHLRQLDQQIGELKLDASKASAAERPESDSRPSSGFYELSDGGSCSSSASCTSVYSECLSSSQTSLLLGPAGPAHAPDESPAQTNPPRAGGLHLGSSRIRAGAEKARPRPVSTGDLDRVIAQGPGHYKPPSACSTLRTAAVDPKFHSNLVTRGGAEVYRYPSPLHAVALQSPIFSHGGDPAGPLEGRGALAGGGSDSLQRAETKSLGYIDELLLRSMSRTQSERGPPVVPLQSQKRRSPEPAEKAERRPSAGAPEGSQRYSSPAATRDYNDEVTAFSPRRNDGAPGEHARGHPERKASRQRAGPPLGCGAESRSVEVYATSPEFVHARFVPAGSQRVKVRQADRKTKALKPRRKSGEKPRATRRHHGASSAERTREAGGGTEGEPRRPGTGQTSHKLSGGRSEERRRGSGSDSSLVGSRQVPPRPPPTPAGATSSRSRRPQGAGYEPPPAEPRKRRPGAARWPADGEMFRAPRSVQAPGVMQPVRGPKWTGPPRSFRSADPFLHSLDARYPAAAFSSAGLRPPRCESEYSAECASLFHSTIAESSEGETSDATANRFGDSESSQSGRSSGSEDEEDRAARQEERALVWAQAALGPAAAGQPPRPEPPACRIKASRALKKKIRRFQPASLKVMTLV